MNEKKLICPLCGGNLTNQGEELASNVELENASENYVTKGMWTALRIHSRGKQFNYDVTPKEIRKMLEAIEKQK